MEVLRLKGTISNEEIIERANFMSTMVYNKTPMEYNSKILRFSALKLIP